MIERLSPDEVADTLECSKKVDNFMLKMRERYGPEAALACGLISVNCAAVSFYGKKDFLAIAEICINTAINRVENTSKKDKKNE